MSARDRKRLEQLTESAQTNAKLDEILDLTRAVNHKIDRLDGRVDDIDVRLAKVENSMAKLGGAIRFSWWFGRFIGIGWYLRLIKAKLGG